MKIYAIEVKFPDDFDVDQEFREMPYGMTLMMKIINMMCILHPAFKKRISSSSKWRDTLKEYNAD